MPTESLQTRPKPPWQRERAKVGYVASCYWMDLWRLLKHSSCAPRFTTKMSAIEEPGRRFFRGWGFHPEGRSENGNDMAMERGRGGGTLSDTQMCTRIRRDYCLKPEMALRGLNASNRHPQFLLPFLEPEPSVLACRSSHSRSREIYLNSNLSVLRWIICGAPLPSNLSAIYGKVEQVAEESDSLKESLDKCFLRVQRQTQEARERAELLGRVNGDSAHVLRIFDDEAQAMQSARNSARMMEEAYSTGVAILSKFSEQRERVKSAQRKALDILNAVGLSNSVLRLIERRNRVDRWIKYMGMILTFVVVILFWRYTR